MRDFTTVFDTYAQFEESVLSAKMAAADEDDDDDNEVVFRCIISFFKYIFLFLASSDQDLTPLRSIPRCHPSKSS